jgi:hypothetical protein
MTHKASTGLVVTHLVVACSEVVVGHHSGVVVGPLGMGARMVGVALCEVDLHRDLLL